MDRIINRGTISHLLSLDHVVGIAYGLQRTDGRHTGKRAILVLVEKKVPEVELREGQIVPKIIEGLLSDVIAVGDGAIRKAGNQTLCDGMAADSRLSRWRPAPGGISIAHYGGTAGTLGAVVYDKETGVPLILSNNHVLANSTNGKDERAQTGDSVLQPAPMDGGVWEQDAIARLFRCVPLNDEGYNVVDAAVAMPVQPGLVTPTILEIGPVRGIVRPQLGMRVRKSGRTSAVTYGIIEGVFAILSIRYDAERVLLFKEQLVISNLDEPGDSGSLILNDYNWAVGLLFGGSDEFTFANPIGPVLSALSVNFKRK